MHLLVEGTPAAAWLGFLIELVIKGFVLIGCAGLTALLLRRSPAFVRSWVWTLAFVMLVLSPVVLLLSPSINRSKGPDWRGGLPLPGSTVCVIQVAESAIPGPAGTSGRSKTTSSGPETRREAFPLRSFNGASNDAPRIEMIVQPRYLFALVVVWLSVAALLTIRVFRRLYAGRNTGATLRVVAGHPLVKAVREAEARLSIVKPVEIRIGADVATPFVSGIFRHRLFLPDSIRDWDRSRLRNILMHELAHVKRKDLARLALVELACALHWFNPMVWWAARRAVLQIEMACDDIVCQGDRSALDYARQLVWFARQAAGSDRSARVPGMAGKPGLEDRVRNIIQPVKTSRMSRRIPLNHGPLRYATGLLIPTLVIALLVPVTGVQSRRSVDTASAGTLSTRRQIHDRSEPARAPTRPPTTIHEAAAAGDLDGLAALLANDPSLLDAVDEKGMTPVALAAWNDRHEIVEYLIGRAADLDIRNYNGLTPLFCTLDRGRKKTARLLIAGGADLSVRGYRGRSLLHMAARTGCPNIIRTLIDRGAEVNATDVDGYTPLDVANLRHQPAIADLLAGYGGVNSGIAPPPTSRPKGKTRV